MPANGRTVKVKGKYLQISSGSRSRSIAKGENAARRSRKKAATRAAFRHERNAN